MTTPTQSYHEGAYMALMKGLKELDLRGTSVPSNLVLTGDHTFPLAVNSRGQVLMAASLYGRGRIVVLGHEGYLAAFPALVENALTWLRGDGSESQSVGVQKNIKAVADSLSKSSFQAKVVGGFSNNLKVGVYVTDAYSVGVDGKALVAFMKAGGGVLIAGQAWSWAKKHPKENTLLQFEGNKVSAVAGIYFSEHQGEAEILPVQPKVPSSWMALGVGKDFKDDLEFLLQGISEFDVSDTSTSKILIHGPLAFPIIHNDGWTFLAGGYYGLGRVMVVTHDWFIKSERLAPFWKNAIGWLDQGRKGVIGVQPDYTYLSESGMKFEETNYRKDLSVYVCSTYYEGVEEIQDFVAEGGGLLLGGHAWNWVNTHPTKHPMRDYPGNKILNKMGLSVLGDMNERHIYKAPVPSQVLKDTDHFRNLLHRFAAHIIQGKELTKQEKTHLKKLAAECTHFLSMKAYNSHSYTHVLSILTEVMKKSGIPQVSRKNSTKDPKDHFLLSMGKELFNASRDPEAILPFLIKDNPLMPVVENQRIKINVNTEVSEEEEWISTGLYLRPGMKTEMIMPANIINKSWTIQISCHTDELEHEELYRAPRVYERFPITSKEMQVSNLWGGLIYLLAPANIKVEGAEVIVQKAVLAPYYKTGVTTAADWSLQRKAPAPWAEFEFDNIILTVPSDVIRDLERVDEVEALWNNIMNGIADLAAIPRKFPRKERMVADVEISAGWMHAGYPIMISTPSAPELFRPGDARTEGLWGEIHELGHNQQRSCWEFPSHTTEATCNLWTVYVHEEVLGLNRAKAHSSMTATARKNLVDKYVKEGRKLSKWNVWVALETYLQLQQKFGWDAFKKVFGAYHKISDYPSDNDGKMNLYAVTFSQTVGMNVTGFLKSWGWPIEKATEEKLSNLPPWSDHPMVKYD